MVTWNKKNGQRATVKRPGTKEYKKDYENREDQFYRKGGTHGCPKCGSVRVRCVGGGGQVVVYCANCGKQVRVVKTKTSKVGNWSQQKIQRSRAGVCTVCGCGRFSGKIHINNAGKYSLQMSCTHCGSGVGWHNL